MMQRGAQGTFRLGGTSLERFRSFLPSPLPPDPKLVLEGAIANALSKADQMLGRLDGLTRILPQPELLIHFYIRKEAVLSSQIEGTQSTLSTLLLFEMDPSRETQGDVRDVANYVLAMNHGLGRLRDGFPVSKRLIEEMHAKLLQTGRGREQTPGRLRTSQNWIGGTRPGNALYVPPPVVEMVEALSDLERFLHGEAAAFPVLIQCALVHLQFESIHPFLDGNGRIGRLLITLLLVERGVLSKPMLYMSLYLKENKDTYYQLLQSVRIDGDWEAWVLFFLTGVRETSKRAVELATRVLDLFRDDESRIKAGTRRGSVSQVFHRLQIEPYMTPTLAMKKTGLSYNTVVASLETLVDLGILLEMPPSGRGRTFRYDRYLNFLDETIGDRAAEL